MYIIQSSTNGIGCVIYNNIVLYICIPRTKYVRGILWFSRRYAAASAFHRLRDNFKNPYRIASIFDMQIDIGERIAGKQDWPGLIIYGPPRAPRIAKNTHFCI